MFTHERESERETRNSSKKGRNIGPSVKKREHEERRIEIRISLISACNETTSANGDCY